MHNTLVYAFRSWGKNNSNISEDVLEKLDLPINKLILQVRFNRQQYLDIVNKGYAHIIGLGQYPSGNTIRIEKVAYNTYGSKSKGYRKIDDGPATISTDLEFSPTPHSTLTYNAGKFVCNYSMYMILRCKNVNQKFAFLHIPKNLSILQAVNYVEDILGQVV